MRITMSAAKNITMTRRLIFTIICLFPMGQAVAVDTEQQTEKSRAAVKMLGGELKATLQTSMKTAGPVESIAVCNVDAPLISRKVTKEKGMSVARTSLKYRNSDNKPDAWESSVLVQFQQRKEKGESVKNMEYSELVEHNGENVYRYMKAIHTGDVCLACHGSNIAPPIANKINELYPDDKATGFSRGDIRGAFTVIQQVE